MSASVAIAEIPSATAVKVEMDRSYENDAESGFYSSANESSNSKDSSWVIFEGEIADPNQFDPPVLQSSNLFEKKCNMVCSVSAIERDSDLTSSKL